MTLRSLEPKSSASASSATFARDFSIIAPAGWKTRCCTLSVMKKLLALLFAVCMVMMAADEISYPEHGRVIGVRPGRVSELVPTYTDPMGKMRKGHSVSKVAQIYRVETDAKIFEFTEVAKKPAYAYGDEIDFRIHTENAFIKLKKKERKVAITATEQKAKAN
jgi:hypothetical protein